MKKMKKVEIITESIYLSRLLEIFKSNDITGYTIIRGIEGCGGHGLKTADEVSDILSNNYVFTVCEEEKFEEIKELVRSFIKKYGGKCIVSDAQMLL